MDYRQAFWPKLRSFFVVLLLTIGRYYEAETQHLCSLDIGIWMISFFAEVKIRPKTTDYSPWFDVWESNLFL